MKPAPLWTSRKLWMTFIASGIVWTAYERSIDHLYAMPVDKCAALVALTQTALLAIAGIASAYVGIAGMVQMRQQVTSEVSQTVSEEIDKRFQTPELKERYDDR